MLHAEQLARRLLMLMDVIGVDRAGSLMKAAKWNLRLEFNRFSLPLPISLIDMRDIELFI